MGRNIKTVSAAGAASGGSAGLSETDVCNVICKSIVGLAATTMLPKCQDKEGWELICNCNNWNECYTSQLEWHVDTLQYRAYRWCFRGMTHCACCHTQFCMCFMTKGGQANGSNWYRWFDLRGDKPWPTGSCCCWHHYSEDYICWCWHCCNTSCSVPQAMAIEIGSSVSKAQCMNGEQAAGGMCYDICYGHRWSACDYANCWGGSNRIKGWTWCHPVVWNSNQHSTRYLEKIIIKNPYGWIPTDIASASWQNAWTNQPQGVPCWSMYGMPCVRPDITGTNPSITSFA
tara:strand:+ start:3582 stop:4442 length:861 start_codon:yes stop_codon:yes gene_type:complete